MLEAETGGLLFVVGDEDGARAARGAEGDVCAPEAPLVGRVVAGEPEAITELYAHYAPLVHGILLARVPYGEVGDLVQDVFLVAFKKIGSLRDRERFGPWVAMIARNRAVDFHRRARVTEELSEELAQGPAPQRAEAEEVLEMIRALPEAYRETLVLRLVEGMTGTEIAERTGLRPDSVRVNLHRGMKQLRERLGLKGRDV
ncbi:MAG TPA: sigma-70 family RNA polymerase sigma factor [Pyrinomonadaceae bacterium]